MVGLSAGAMQSERERSLGAGMDDFLPKPIETRKLREVLERYTLFPALFSRELQEESSFGGGGVHFDVSLLTGEFEDPLVVEELVETSLEMLPEMFVLLQEALEEENRKKCVTAAHSIKGVALNMRFSRLRILAESLEKCCCRGGEDLSRIKRLCRALEEEWLVLASLLQNGEWKRGL